MKKTVVMIHGMWGGAWCWDYYKPFFEEKGYECYTPVLSYHDMDPNDEPNPALGTVSILDYAQELENYISRLDEKPILMGHSMGGLLAQILGARDLAKGLVLLTPASPSGINAFTYSVLKSFIGLFIKWGFWRKPYRPSFKTAVYSTMHLLSEADQKEAYSRFVYESGKATAEIGYWLLDWKRATRVDESKVTCPVLVIAGSEDRITPPKVAQKVANKYNSVSTHEEFEGHAHWVLGQPGWEDVAEFVNSWLIQAKL